MRPYVVLSVATSIDGYIDDLSPERLVLSTTGDFDRVDQVRADSDAILVGAETLRRDDPRLLIRDPARRAARVAAGKPEHPIKVTVTGSGDLAPDLRFWSQSGEKVIYTTDAAAPRLRERRNTRPMPHDGAPADVVALGPSISFPAVLDDLAARGVGRLMVEGGGAIHTAFLAQGLADEIHLALAPLLVGQPGAPRFLHPAAFPGAPGRRLRLLEARAVDDMVLIRYAVQKRPGPGEGESSATEPGARAGRDSQEDPPGVSGADLRWLHMAVELARLCPPSRTAFSVGAIIVDAAGHEISRGHSRESDPHVHAEEAALAKLPEGDPRLAGATIYTSLEPCCRRRSRPRTCTELILAAGIRRVVLAWREPDTFVADCQGAELLTGAGAEVIEIPALAEAARAPNAHLNL